MFERFTDRARRVVVLAQEEARRLDHNYIGTEHLLLALSHEGEGVAARSLESLGISLDVVRVEVEEIIGRGGEAPSGHIPFTPRAKKVLELSLREALQLGHNYIGTEHILLGLVREGEGVAAQVLVKLGAELAEVRRRVVELIAGTSQGQVPEAVVASSLEIENRTLRRLIDRLRTTLRHTEGTAVAEPEVVEFPASTPAAPEAGAAPSGLEEAVAPQGHATLLKCSFCGKSQTQVRKLVAGPGVYICDECIELCVEILEEEPAPPPPEEPAG